MMMMGITISLAGKPSRKAMRITPSRPSRRAKGSRKPVHQLRMLSPPTCTLAHSQISRPGRGGHRRRPAQDKEGAVQYRAHHHLPDTGPPVGGQLQGEGGGHAAEKGA